MSDEHQTPPPPPPPPPQPSSPIVSVTHDDRQIAFVIYILYLAHFVPVIGWVATIVGLVLAYVERDTAPDWLKSHYTFQIRTFWIGLLYCVVSVCLIIILIGIPLLLAAWIWFIVRCALGLSRLLRAEAYPTPESWTV
jgi:uncharacterized membrane protein